MLRVGLTGGLGSGKSSVALVFQESGAHILEADAIGRALMQPGQAVYQAIVDTFGPGVVQPDGRLDRKALAVEAFEHSRLQELNAIVHPAVLDAQQRKLDAIGAADPHAIAVVETALLFESKYRAGDAHRSPGQHTPTADRQGAPDQSLQRPAGFDRIVLVTAPLEVKVARYVARVAPVSATPDEREAFTRDAHARLAAQIPDADKAPFCDYVIENTRTLVLLRRRTQAVFAALRADASARGA